MKTLTLTPIQYSVAVAYHALAIQFTDPEEIYFFNIKNETMTPPNGGNKLIDCDRGFKSLCDNEKIIFERFQKANPEIIPLLNHYGVELGEPLPVEPDYELHDIIIAEQPVSFLSIAEQPVSFLKRLYSRIGGK